MGRDRTRAEAIETHTARVFLMGTRAYKLKKPVHFDFVDFRTPEARRSACEKELTLNSRLASDVYLEVLDIMNRRGERVDSLFSMRRLPSDRQLSTLVDEGLDISSELRNLAHVMAAFHASELSEPQLSFDAVSARGDGGPERVICLEDFSFLPVSERMADLFRENLDQLRRVSPREVEDDIHRIAQLSETYAEGRWALFASRNRAGRVRDGHGDLRCENIFCLEDGPRVTDCLEFDDRLSILNGLCDVSFLAADLDYRGRPVEARFFLDEYSKQLADLFPGSLARYYMAYWATVRAKASFLGLSSGHASSGPLSEDPLKWISLARRYLEEGQVRLVMVGGQPGVGTSTFSAALAEVEDWVMIRSDEVRRDLSFGHFSSKFRPSGYEKVSIGLGNDTVTALDEGGYCPQPWPLSTRRCWRGREVCAKWASPSCSTRHGHRQLSGLERVSSPRRFGAISPSFCVRPTR